MAGRVREFQKGVEGMLKSATKDIRAAFEGDQYAQVCLPNRRVALDTLVNALIKR